MNTKGQNFFDEQMVFDIAGTTRTFSNTDYNNALNDTTNLWNRMMASRTPRRSSPRVYTVSMPAGQTPPITESIPVPGPTVAETGNPTDDRPFQPYGTAAYQATGAGGYVPAGTNVQDTVLRTDATTGRGLFDVTDAALTRAGVTTGSSQDHPYLRSELLRKIANNITTRSNVFAVYITIGYFEVRNPAPYNLTNRPILGREMTFEMFNNSGQRPRFFAIVDRTKLAAEDVTVGAPTGAARRQAARPWMGMLAQAVPQGGTTLQFHVTRQLPATGTPTQLQVDYDGQTVTISTAAPNNRLRLGTGDAANAQGDGEWVTVQSLGALDTTNGLASVALTTPTLRPHAAGSPVANAVFGNPGPQPAFDYTDPRYQGVVPFVTQLR